MPYAVPPAVAAPALPSDYELPSGMIERARAYWLVPLRPQPRARVACPQAKDSEIVVCARREDDPARDRMGAPIPDAPTAMQVLARKMTVRIGPAEVHPQIGVSPGIPDPAPYAGVSLRIKF